MAHNWLFEASRAWQKFCLVDVEVMQTTAIIIIRNGCASAGETFGIRAVDDGFLQRPRDIEPEEKTTHRQVIHTQAYQKPITSHNLSI